MDWLSDHKAEVIYHEKVVGIPLLDGQVLRVLGEKPKEKIRQLMSDKSKEKKQDEIAVFRIELVPGAIPVGKSLYLLAPSEFDELSGQLKELQDKDPSKIEAVKNWEVLRTPFEVRSFLELDKLCNAPVLALPDGSKDFVVYCVSSGLGLGCVLMQRAQKEASDESAGLQRG
nr:hypothetical protein [Tanacetum cinerariifolium]